MICTDSVYETCHKLFLEYPLAVETLDESGLVQSMVLVLADGDEGRFFVLVADHTRDTASFSLFPWRADDSVDIKQDACAVPDSITTVLTRGVPIPRDGSLFGWVQEGGVTTLIGIQARYAHSSPVPSWAAMPLADIPATEWPPFTGERSFGAWFWDYYQDHLIVLLDELIAGTTNLVFWVDTKDLLGSDCCAVVHDIKSAEGYTLRQGCYVYYRALQVAKPVPSLAQLLERPGKTDLGPEFQLPGLVGDGPPGDG